MTCRIMGGGEGRGVTYAGRVLTLYRDTFCAFAHNGSVGVAVDGVVG